MSSANRNSREHPLASNHQISVADNDDELPEEIGRIIDALARSAARRDHHAATKGTADRD